MKVLRNLLLPVLLLLNFICSAQTTKFNYDRHMMGWASRLTYHYPKNVDKDSFQFDKGAVSPDMIFFYQWKKKSLFTPFIGWENRTAEFRYPGRFQTTDKFITAGFLVGKRLYIVDHALFADYNLGLSARKLLKRKYVSEYDDPGLINSLPVNKSFGNAFIGSLASDLRLHFEIRGKGATIYVGLSSTGDIFKLGNSSRFNEFTKKYSTISLALGLASF